MRRLVILAILPIVAFAGQTSEVLVGTVPTLLPYFPTRRGLLVENHGPNPIWCAMSEGATVIGSAHKIAANGGRFPFNAPDRWWCVAEGAAQVAGAATVVSEVQ